MFSSVAESNAATALPFLELAAAGAVEGKIPSFGPKVINRSWKPTSWISPPRSSRKCKDEGTESSTYRIPVPAELEGAEALSSKLRLAALATSSVSLIVISEFWINLPVVKSKRQIASSVEEAGPTTSPAPPAVRSMEVPVSSMKNKVVGTVSSTHKRPVPAPPPTVQAACSFIVSKLKTVALELSPFSTPPPSKISLPLLSMSPLDKIPPGTVRKSVSLIVTPLFCKSLPVVRSYLATPSSVELPGPTTSPLPKVMSPPISSTKWSVEGTLSSTYKMPVPAALVGAEARSVML